MRIAPHRHRRSRNAEHLREIDRVRKGVIWRRDWCAQSASASWRPIVRTGLSEIIGSRKTMAMSRPRSLRISRYGRRRRSVSRKRMRPPAIVA
jgi:hypothetical protein